MEVKESSSEDAVAYSSYLIDPAINFKENKWIIKQLTFTNVFNSAKWEWSTQIAYFKDYSKLKRVYLQLQFINDAWTPPKFLSKKRQEAYCLPAG